LIKIFSHYFHRGTVLQIVFDLTVMLLALVAATSWLAVPFDLILPMVLPVFVLCAAGLMVINWSLGFYQRGHNRSFGQTGARAVLALMFALPLVAIVTAHLAQRETFRLALTVTIVVILLFRVFVAHSSPMGMLSQRVLVFGTGRRAKSVGLTLRKSDPNVQLIGYYASPTEAVTEVSAWGLLSPDKSLTDIVMDEQVDEIVVALGERRGGSMPLRELLDCKLQGVRVIDIATHFEKTLGQIRLESVSAGWLIFGEGFAQGFLRTTNKRLFDIVFGFILILVTWPIMLVTGILILIESGGPMLYLQERVGLNGRLFNVVKFRSMRNDAEKDGKPRWASATDDRVTRVGRVIRKLRIDELPQLFSVLGGSMSLVGPRPERPYFVDKLTQEIPYFGVRQSVKPGVTGWAQVRYQYGASIEDAAEKLQYDLYYVKNHSLFLDLIILFETVGVVLMRKGAQ
jgi:sugar transferase (PEP-CTERM system associated)